MHYTAKLCSAPPRYGGPSHRSVWNNAADVLYQRDCKDRLSQLRMRTFQCTGKGATIRDLPCALRALCVKSPCEERSPKMALEDRKGIDPSVVNVSEGLA